MAVYWTKERIVEALRKHWTDNGHLPTAAEWRNGGTLEHPSAAHVEGVFGSWSGALRAAEATADADIERQRKAEQKQSMTVDLFNTRVGAVFDASEATAHGEEGGQESLRQSLIDLAACAETMADDLPPPEQWMDGDERHAEEVAYRQRWRAERRANGLAA